MSSDEEWKPVAKSNHKKEQVSEEEEEEWKPKKSEPGKKWSDSEEEEWVPYVPTEPLKKEIELDDPGELKLYYTSLNVNPDYFYKSRDLKIMLEQFGLKYTKIDLNLVNEFRVEMESISKKKNLPQLFIDENYLGSFEDIMYWVENEEFEKVLQEQGYKSPEYIE
jgi:glutaredoxin-related protein